MACSCGGSCTRCKQQGGLLQGPSHAQGGMPAIIGGKEPVELEGGEYIIRKSSVDKYGEGTIARINQGLVDPNKLRQLKEGGPIRNGSRNNRRSQMARGRRAPQVRRGTAPARRMRSGGTVARRRLPVRRKMQNGGMTMNQSCPPGTTMRNGRCIPSNRGVGLSTSTRRRYQGGGSLSAGRNLAKICKNRPKNKKLLDSQGRDMCLGHR